MEGVRNLLRIAKEWSELADRDSDMRKEERILRIQTLAQRISVGIYCSHIIYLILRSVTRSDSILASSETKTKLGHYILLIMQVD
jgi:hypothetical protein